LEEKEVKLAIFNAKDLSTNKYLDFDELETLCKKMDLPMVQVIEKGDCFNYSVSELKNVSKGMYPNTKNPREGLVFRLSKDWHTDNKRHSFKIINDDFLLNHK